MKPKFLQNLHAWIIVSALGLVLIFSVLLYLFCKNIPYPPRAVVLSVCRSSTNGVRRIQANFGTQFDVSQSLFTVEAGMRDMPPGTLYVVTLKNGRNNMVVWQNDEIFSELKSGVSNPVGERQIRSTNGIIVGEDRWGYLNDGDRWRYVRFFIGDAVGYQPVSPRQAALFDQIISSACVSPGPQNSHVQ